MWEDVRHGSADQVAALRSALALRRSIAMLQPGARDALDRERALRLLADLQDVTGRLEELKRRLRELADQT